MAFSDSVRSNDRRAALVALRDKLAITIENTESGRDIAALSKRLMEVMAEIDTLPDSQAEDDPIEAARKSRSR